MSMNPLSKYTKIEELSVKLISNNAIPYKPGVLGDKGIKCGVCARSARDEMVLSTPDMLLSGDAISKVIENCVPNVINADDLYVNDVEQLLIAIKLASKEETYDINTTCPECKHAGRFERSFSYLLDTANSFKEIPYVNLDNGLAVYFKPFTWGEYSDFAQRMLKEQQEANYLDDVEDMSDDDKIKSFSEIFEKIAQLNFDMIVKSIFKIVTPEGDEVQESAFISEWLSSQSKSVLKVIRTKMDEVLDLGIEHKMEVQCSECSHEWELTDLKYDPSFFFDMSFSTQPQRK